MIEALMFSDAGWVRFGVLPFVIFFARILDVSVGTLRLALIARGRRLLAALCGFVEVLVWLLVVAGVLHHIDNVAATLAYCAGFSAGTWVGLWLDEHLALGSVLLRVITRDDPAELVAQLGRAGFRPTSMAAESESGPVRVVFMALRRGAARRAIELVRQSDPDAFYTVEDLRQVSAPPVMPGVVIARPPSAWPRIPSPMAALGGRRK